MPNLRDRFASWLCSRRLTWTLAEAGFMSARLLPLCIARNFDVTVRWEHLTGRVSINTADGAGAHMAQGEAGRYA